MTRPRRAIASLATSADGYIAHPDGDAGWLERPRPKGSYGMGAFLQSIDTILLGRRTYEVGLKLGGGRLGFNPRVRRYVFSRSPPRASQPGVEFVRDSPGVFVRLLRSTPGKNIWIMGGAGLIGSLLDEDQIDRFDIHVVPVFIGEGIPLIEPRHRLVILELLSARRFPDGLVRLVYQPKRAKVGGTQVGARRK
jgi:dihydrofolate reductase